MVDQGIDGAEVVIVYLDVQDVRLGVGLIRELEAYLGDGFADCCECLEENEVGAGGGEKGS